jgi:hypothetical protein
MANRERAEQEILLGGKKRLLRPSFEALCEIEEKAGEGVPALLSRFGKGTMGFRSLAAILYGGMRGAGDLSLSFEQVGELVVKDGIRDLILPCAQFLAAAVSPPSKEGGPGKDEEKPRE